MFSPNSGRPCAKYPAAAAQAAKVTFMKAGERPIIPPVGRAQCDIMTRRRSSSSRVRGTMKDRPTRSPLVGDTYVMSSRRPGSCCMSYSEAMARTPLASPGCVVTSLTRSPPSQTSRCWSWSPLMYCRPVRAPMVAISDLPGRRRADVVVWASRNDGDVGLGLGIVVESDGPFPAHVPSRPERCLQGPGGLHDRGVVRRSFRLGDHELAADQLDVFVGLEDAQLDQPIVLGAAEAARSRLVTRHRGHRIGGPGAGQRLRMDAALPVGADLG